MSVDFLSTAPRCSRPRALATGGCAYPASVHVVLLMGSIVQIEPDAVPPRAAARTRLRRSSLECSSSTAGLQHPERKANKSEALFHGFLNGGHKSKTDVRIIPGLLFERLDHFRLNEGQTV